MKYPQQVSTGPYFLFRNDGPVMPMQEKCIEILLELIRSMSPVLLLGTLTLLSRSMKVGEEIGLTVGRWINVLRNRRSKSFEKRCGAIGGFVVTAMFVVVFICVLITKAL